MNITVCIATIPPRAEQLARALKSVAQQTLQPQAIVVEYDHEHVGAAPTKNFALAKVTTEWTAFLDDDDEFLPQHLELLAACAEASSADLVYSIPIVPESPSYVRSKGDWYKPFAEADLRDHSFIQTTVLARTKLVSKYGFYCPPGSPYDDWGMCLGVLDQGGKLVHLPVETFIWHHWAGNTSGNPKRW